MEYSFISGQVYVWGKFDDYTGSVITSEDLELPDDFKIKLWDPLPSMALLTFQGVTVTGPARLELLRSYAHELCNSPEKQQDISAIRREVDNAISSKSDKVKDAH